MSTSLVSLASLVQAFNPVTPQLRVAAILEANRLSTPLLTPGQALQLPRE